jgi:hypothetical protein
MKRIILTVIANLLIVFGFSQDFWELVTTEPDSVSARCLEVSTDGGIYLGMSGFMNPGGIYRSINNAQTWQYLGLDEKPIYALEVCSNGDIIAGVYSGIFKSNDNGNSWYEVYYSSGNITQITSLTNGYVFAGGVDNLHGIIRSTDFGETWDTVHIFTNYGQENLKCITASTDGHIWAGTYNMFGDGSITFSTDLGETWSELNTPDFPPYWPWVFSLAVHPQGDLFAGFYGCGLYRYSFSTQQWTLLTDPWVTPDDILFIGENRIFVGLEQDPNGFDGVIYSEDGGQNFEPLNSGINNGNGGSINFISRHPTKYIYALGFDFYRSFEPIQTNIKENEQIEDYMSCSLPNPFKSQTKILWNNSRNVENVEILVFNGSGLILLKQIIRNNGYYLFCANYLEPGIYFYSIIEENITYSGKMVLLK